jgi:TRAP-type C4-dicarboxylate transport system permease small subunit
MPVRVWSRLEAAVTAFERALVVALLALMVVAVFLDATHRIFAAQEGRLERLLVAVAPVALESVTRRFVAPALLAIITFVVLAAALRARDASKPRARRLALAAAGTAALAAAATLFVRLVPSGLVWSQQMALCFMLWVALAGASLGARERAHIAFELAGQIWPLRWRRPVERLARALAAAFTLFLALLAAAHAREHYLEWRASGGSAGLFEAFRVPRWLVFGFLPLPLTMTAIRFLVYGLREDAPAQAAP